MIKVNFNTYNNYVSDSLYQWDINRKLIINGLNLSDAPEIHFANANMDRAIVRQSTLKNGNITVKIPNSLLQSALTIKAYVGLYEGETFKVVETIEIPVVARKRPSDYTIEIDDEEIYSFNRLETIITNVINENEQFLEEMKEDIEQKIDEVIDAEILKDLHDMVAKLDVAVPLMLDAWELDEVENVYKQTVAVETVTATDEVLILLSTVEAEATEDELNAFACLMDETIIADGSITFIASEKPSMSFTVIAKGVATNENQAIADVTHLVAEINKLNSNLQRMNKALTLAYDSSRTLKEVASYCFNNCLEVQIGAIYQGLIAHGSLYKFEAYTFFSNGQWSGTVTLECYTNGEPSRVSFSVINGVMYP